MKKICMGLIMAGLISGCGMQSQVKPTPIAPKATEIPIEKQASSELTHIVAQMAEQMLSNDVRRESAEPIAVASFVDLQSLQQTNWLGQQIAESFIHELHRLGQPVVDYKLTGTIRITPQGDFVLSRNWKDLAKRLPITRILTGTLSQSERGVIINARIIALDSRFVDATAQGFIPYELIAPMRQKKRTVTSDSRRLIRDELSVSKKHMIELSH